jgi:hypothetical protein
MVADGDRSMPRVDGFCEEAMRAKDIVGKRIARVIQQRRYNDYTRSMTNVIESIVLEDGTTLRPVITEWRGDYSVDFIVSKRGH